MKNVCERKQQRRSHAATALRASSSHAEEREPFAVRVERFRAAVAELIVRRILAAQCRTGRAGGAKK